MSLRDRFRWNRPYPDLSTDPLVSAAELETVVELDLPPGNVTTSPDGRIFFDLHPLAQPRRFAEASVFELVDGEPRPYPDLASQDRYAGVLGMTVDAQGRLWMVEPKGLESHPTRLLGFDLETDELIYEIEFSTAQSRFAQDMRVSPDGSTMYLADTGIFTFIKPRLIVLDLDARRPRTVLRDHPSVRPQRIATRTNEGFHNLAWGAVAFRVGIDGIALSPDGDWLYYAAINHDGLFRIPRAMLDDPAVKEADLSPHIERVATKVLNDGIDIGPDGVIYLTDVEHGGLATIDQTGSLRTLVSSDDIVWADGVVIAADGSAIFTDSAIPAYIDQLGRPPRKQRIDAAGPFHIYRVPDAVGRVARATG